jgi:hypothetical protein
MVIISGMGIGKGCKREDGERRAERRVEPVCEEREGVECWGGGIEGVYEGECIGCME